MGGKGGGDDQNAQAMINNAYDTTSHPGYYIDRKTGIVRDANSTILANSAEEMWPTPAAATPEPTVAPAAAAAPEPTVVAPDPTPTTPAPTGPAVDPGGAISQPTASGNTTGDQLGGSILNAPKYWVGGIDTFNRGRNSSGIRGSGSKLTTTQT